MDLIGSRGVQISEMSIESPRAGGIRSERSSFTLTRSRVLDNRARPGVRISLGSQAVLVGNDIQGATNGVRVEMGRFYEEPGWAPSEALLIENRIRATGTAGLWVQGRGTRVQGAGNRYEGSTAEGVHVSGGASYVGWRDSMSDNQGNGLRALGCELLCRAAGCTDPRDPVFVQEPTFATLESATILRNRQVGVYVGCGASARITEAVVSGNQDGLMVQSPVALDGAHIGSMPARLEIVHSRVTGNLVSGAVVLSTPYADDEWAEAAIDARDTVFAGHTGIWLLGKGALGRGWGNRYEHGTYGLHVSGGASYFGKQDTMADNGDFGVFALGHEVMCDVPGCGSVGIVRGSSRVRLVGAVARGNGAGLLATCGATIELLGSHITSSRWEGAVAYSSCDWGDMGVSSAPSDIRSRGSVFAENGGFGLMAWEDSQLRLGSLYDPGRNSFVGNLGGAIANYSTACVPALWNWFGTADEGAIAASLMGCVEFVPFLTQAP